MKVDGGGLAWMTNEKETPHASLTLTHARSNSVGFIDENYVLDKHDQA